MKTKILLFFSLFSFLLVNAQWYQYVKPSMVNQMVKDGSGNYHYATDVGYVKFDNSFNVVGFRNLVTQTSPIGNVTSLDINPLNEQEIALCEQDRVSIWVDGILSQTIELASSIPNYNPQICYNNNDEIYVFDPSQEDFKVISNGTLTDITTPGIRPQAIVENNEGTKIYCAGWNNGLWEYTKATDTWVNFNESNSNLIYNVLLSLFVDDDDLLYIGSFQGLNTLDPSGTMASCQQNVAPGNPFFFAVHEIDVNSNGDVLVRSSEPNGGSNFGFCLVDLDSCSWANYTNDGSNCLDSNGYKTVQFSPSGNEVVATKTGFNSNGSYYFTINAPSPTCSELDFNYMDATDMYRSFGFSEVGLRESDTPGNFDLAITNENGVDILSLPEENFDGNFPSPTNFDPFSGFPYDIIDNGDYFIITDNTNTFTFLNRDGTSTSHTLSLPDFTINKTKRANEDVSGPNCTLVFNGWQGPGFDTKLYITECNMENGSCSEPVEICSNNRNTSEPITFECAEDADSDNFRCVAIKENNAGEITLTEEVVSPENGTETIVFDGLSTDLIDFIEEDPVLLNCDEGSNPEIYIKNQNGDLLAKVNRATGDALVYNFDGNVYVVYTANKQYANAGTIMQCIAGILSIGSSGSEQSRKDFNVNAIQENSSRNPQAELPTIELPESIFSGLPTDVFIYSITAYPYNSSNFAVVLMTNYGILIKSEIDYSFLSLGIEETDFAENIELYPNPSNDLVSFTDTSINEIMVYSMQGKKVKESNSNTISVKTLPNGIYLVKGVKTNGGELVKKLIKN